MLCKAIKDVTKQEDLACILVENPTLHYFIINLFWNILRNLRMIYYNTDFSNKATIIFKENGTFEAQMSQSMKKITEDNIIKSIGFEEAEIVTFLEFVENNQFSRFASNNIFVTKIHAITTCFSTLNGCYYQSIQIINDSELFNKFLSKLKKIFNLPETFTREQFFGLYDSGRGLEPKDKKAHYYAFNMLMTKILHTSENTEGVIQMNYGREIFTRKDRDPTYTKQAEDITKCFKDITSDPPEQIYGVKNYLDVKNTFVNSVFNLYGKKVIGGISGSSYYFYFLVTNILKYTKSKTLLSKILCIVVLDYVPLWHSLEEILLTFSVEYEKYGFPRYTLDQDPVIYFRNVVCDVDSIVEDVELPGVGTEVGSTEVASPGVGAEVGSTEDERPGVGTEV